MLTESALDRDVLTEIPDHISFEEAVLAEPLACCLNAWNNIRPEHVNNVLILGGGLLGILHAMTAKVHGIKKICIVEPDLSRHLYRSHTGSEYFDETSLSLLRNKTSLNFPNGFDLIIIACKCIIVNDSLISLLNTGGTLSLFSGFNTGSVIKADPRIIHYKELTITGSYGCSTVNCKDAMDLISCRKIIAGDLITHRLPFDEIYKGFENTKNHKGLKTVIIF
jgi:L-iditol 2-dehydrogenase